MIRVFTFPSDVPQTVSGVVGVVNPPSQPALTVSGQVQVTNDLTINTSGIASEATQGTINSNIAKLVGFYTSASASVTSVNNQITSQQIVASNPNRKGLIIYNTSNLASVNINFGSPADMSTAFVLQLPAHGSLTLEPPALWTGAIYAIASAANGALQITELS